MTEPSFLTTQLTPDQVPLMRKMLTLFGEAFHDASYFTGRQPSDTYLAKLLGGETFIALAATDGAEVLGALAAYELKKFEQERSEIYIYDLAVAETARRRGVATGLIEALKAIGRQRGAWVIFVQADTEEEDIPAINLYTKLGTREDVLHFDIAVEDKGTP